MKIELIKMVKEITGDVYFYVQANKNMVQGTFTHDPDEAARHFVDTTMKAKEFPMTTYETIREEEI